MDLHTHTDPERLMTFINTAISVNCFMGFGKLIVSFTNFDYMKALNKDTWGLTLTVTLTILTIKGIVHIRHHLLSRQFQTLMTFLVPENTKRFLIMYSQLIYMQLQ